MAASREDISGWFDRGVRDGATHMIVVCDTFDWDDYPVYVQPGEDARTVASKYMGQNMQRVMEVYSLKQDKAKQMTERRVFNYD